MTKVAIIGAAGRMGRALVQCAARNKDLKVVAAIEAPGNPAVGSDAGQVAGIASVGVTVCADMAVGLADADAVIVFTLHDAVTGYAQAAARAGRALVIGSTGLTGDEIGAVKRAAERVPIVWAPNMSLGVNLLFAEVKKAAGILGGYRVSVDETHHIHKKDAPSGTALRLGEKAAEGLGQDFKSIMVHDPEGRGGTHPEGKILMRSFRRGEVLGDHTVVFENEGERIEFTHHVWSRDALAMGALRAAQWVVTRRPGLYDMQDVLGL